MADKPKTNYIWIVIAVVAVVVLAIVFISNSNKNVPKEISPKQITLSQNDFAFIKSSYLNAQQYSAPDCSGKGKYGCEADGQRFDCPKPDLLTLYLKIVNLDEGVTTYSPKYKDLLVCNIQDGESSYPNQRFYHNEQTGLSEVGPLNMDYSKAHNLVICCKIRESNVVSNELCLSPIKIESLC